MKYIILMYHSLGKRDPLDYLKLRINPESFEEQLAYFSEEKYEVTALSKIFNMSDSGMCGLAGKCRVCITFDDGYLDNLQLALPILRKYAFPATFFIATDYLYKKANKRHYWEEWDYLSLEDLKELNSPGIEIGSHSCSHRVLTRLDDCSLKEEAVNSKNLLEDILQKEIALFSYPHGKFNHRVSRVLQQAGYLAACTSILGFNSDNTDPFELRRIEIRGDDSLDDFKNKLEGRYNWLGYFQKMRLWYGY